MNQTLEKLKSKTLVGIKIRTNNLREIDEKTGLIGPCIQNYFQNQLFEKIQHRKVPGVTFCVYTEYDSDHTGDYSYFIGEEVSKVDEIPEGLSHIEIPEQSYEKFCVGPGAMPDIVRKAWFEIWEKDDLTAKRTFQADFEVYDERSHDQNNAILDIYIGVN